MTSETRELLQKAEKARALYSIGKISRKQARSQIEPYIQAFNAKSKEISKKYKMKPKLISFSQFVR